MSLTALQKFELKKFVKELEKFRGRHTELVSVYIPQGYDINKINNHLSQEKGTAANIKSASTRKNVVDALERMLQHLKLFKVTPPHGLAVFSGNVAEREGSSNVEVWSLEPPVPLNTRIYRCDKAFQLDLLEDMLEVKEAYGLVVMDRREGDVAILKGKSIIPLSKAKSNVPGKTRAGGQCVLSDSVVQLADGSILDIKSLHNPQSVKSIDLQDFSLQDSNIIDKWDVKKDKVYRIVTKNPRLEVSASKDHVFFVSSKEGIVEKSSAELKKGDLLIMPEKIDIRGTVQKLNTTTYYNSYTIKPTGLIHLKAKRGVLSQKELAKRVGITQTAVSLIEFGRRNIKKKVLEKLCCSLSIDFVWFLKKFSKPASTLKLPDKVDKSLAQILGYFIGDGDKEDERINFSEQNHALARHYQKIAAEYFNAKSSIKFRVKKGYYQIRIYGKPIVKMIIEEFPEASSARKSLVPEKILKSNKKIVASFLKGLFDAEGYVSTNQKLGISMNNKMIIRQVQLLLLRFGIITSFLVYDNRQNYYSINNRYTLEISEKESLELFRKHMGFSSQEKTKKLDHIIKKKSNTSYVRQIFVSGSSIRKIIEKAGLNLESFPKVSNFFYDQRMISKNAFRSSIMNYVKDKSLLKELKKICDIPVLPVQINHISIRNKEAKMVDISVKNQNFIANGIIMHNSAARYERLREGAAVDFYKKIADMMKEQFLGKDNIKGIIVGGPGPTKHSFIEGGFITNDVKKKIIAIKDLGYTGDFGLQELVDKSEDVLAEEEIADEKKVMLQFFTLLSTKPKMVTYGADHVKKALDIGAVDILLVSESLDDDYISKMEEKAKELNSTVKIISVETREGVQLRDIGKIAAILRYEAEI